MPSILESLKATFGLASKTRDWSVGIEETGRNGSVTYRDAAGSLSFYWEFGGGDTVATLEVGTESEWRSRPPWAAARRTEILRRIADEVIRQKATKHRGSRCRHRSAPCR